MAIAQLTQANATLAARLPELEAPRETPEASEPVQEEPERAERAPVRYPRASDGLSAAAFVVAEGVRKIGGTPWQA